MYNLLVILVALSLGSTGWCQGAPKTKEIQELTFLSSSQFYTQFALIRKMLEAEWDEEVFEKFSLYDGMNLQLMEKYERELKDDKIWGPFLAKKNGLHKKVYAKLAPLIEKKRKGQAMVDEDKGLLMELDKKIFEELVK